MPQTLRCSRSIGRFAVVIALGWAILLGAPVRAQDTSDAARTLVSEGIEAARDKDWTTALNRFQRAYDIEPLPLTLYNLAAAQEQTGPM